METKTNVSLLLMRLALGCVIGAHGLMKLMFFDGTMTYFTDTQGMPYFLGVLVILGESLGCLALIFGLFTRFVAASLFVIMLGAMVLDHAQYGFFMDWFRNQKGEGIEFDILTFGLSLGIMIMGAGAYSLDSIFKIRNLKFGIIPGSLSPSAPHPSKGSQSKL